MTQVLLPLLGVTIGIAIGLLIAARQFSLRTLLIAATLIALAFGLISALNHWPK